MKNTLFESGNQFVVISKADFDAIVSEAVLARMEAIENNPCDQGKILMPQNVEDELLTRKQTATLLSVDPMTLSRWEKANYLIPVRAGRRVLYRRQDIMNALQKGGKDYV